jgi:hypothetical protein
VNDPNLGIIQMTKRRSKRFRGRRTQIVSNKCTKTNNIRATGTGFNQRLGASND